MSCLSLTKIIFCLAYVISFVNSATVVSTVSPAVAHFGRDAILNCLYKTDAAEIDQEIITWKIGDRTIHQRFADTDVPAPGYEGRTSTIFGRGHAELELKNVSMKDVREYTCDVQISNQDGGQDSGNVQLQVKFVSTVSPAVAYSGHDAILNCTYKTDATETTKEVITWKIGNETIHQRLAGTDMPFPGYEGRTSTIHGRGHAELKLKNVSWTDEREYTCDVQISNQTGGQDSGNVQLQVLRDPVPKAQCEGCRCSLTCEIMSVHPAVICSWKGPGDTAIHSVTKCSQGLRNLRCVSRINIYKLLSEQTYKSIFDRKGHDQHMDKEITVEGLTTVPPWYHNVPVILGCLLVICISLHLIVIGCYNCSEDLKGECKPKDKGCLGFGVASCLFMCIISILFPLFNCLDGRCCDASWPMWSIGLVIVNIILLVTNIFLHYHCFHHMHSVVKRKKGFQTPANVEKKGEDLPLRNPTEA